MCVCVAFLQVFFKLRSGRGVRDWGLGFPDALEADRLSSNLRILKALTLDSLM